MSIWDVHYVYITMYVFPSSFVHLIDIHSHTVTYETIINARQTLPALVMIISIIFVNLALIKAVFL